MKNTLSEAQRAGTFSEMPSESAGLSGLIMMILIFPGLTAWALE
jgi:hypothetical protein